MKNNNLFKKIHKYLMNMPARRHRTSPHKGTSCGAKGGMLADGPRFCTKINEYCMK